MKRWLTQFAPNKALGLFIDEDEITASLVVGFPLGAIEVARHKENYKPGQLTTVLQHLVKSLSPLGKASSYPVALGLPAVRVFFSTRPIRNTKNDASPQVLLREALQSPNFPVDDMVVEVLKTQPGKRPVVSLVSCRKKYLAHFLKILEEGGFRPPRAEPALGALLRAGVFLHKAPRRAKVVLRLFLGEKQGLGVVAVANSPVIWRFFDLCPGKESQAILSVTRALQALIQPCGIDTPLEAILIHGTGPLRQLVETEEFQESLGMRATWCEGPSLDNSAIAFGLALGGLDQTPETLDLARSLKPLPSLRDIFPWKEITLQIMLLVGMAVYLIDRSLNLQENYLTIQAENQRHAWATSQPLAKLEREKKDLDKKVAGLRSFVGSRIQWSRYTQDITARLPSNIFLTSMQGIFELDGGGSGKGNGSPGKRSLVLRATTPMGPQGSTPPEIEKFINSLRNHPYLQRDFPQVDLVDIKSVRSSEVGQTVATFTVVCLPKAKTAPKSADNQDAKKEGKHGEQKK